jgi:hypothetical protein
MHRTNPAKYLVRTWKNHFTAGLAGLPPLFPLAHWCQLMLQSNTTLNMMCLCCCNSLLSAHKVLERTFLFNAMPMALLGMEVPVHQKPDQHNMWGYYAAKAWHLSHAIAHYRCICVIMKDVGGECAADTFHYQHLALLVPIITATNRILEALCRLANAINGVQEAPLDKMTAIQSLQALHLGKKTPQEPETSLQPCRPKALLAVSPPAETEHGDPPIRMWNPHADKTPAIHKSHPLARLPTSPAPAVIEDVIDNFYAPPDTCCLKKALLATTMCNHPKPDPSPGANSGNVQHT